MGRRAGAGSRRGQRQGQRPRAFELHHLTNACQHDRHAHHPFTSPPKIQTGTGKTYTMTGDIDAGGAGLSAGAGVIPRAIHQIFNYLEVSAWRHRRPAPRVVGNLWHQWGCGWRCQAGRCTCSPAPSRPHLRAPAAAPQGLASEYSVKCSYLELYNEEITDLLAVGDNTPKASRGHGGRALL